MRTAQHFSLSNTIVSCVLAVVLSFFAGKQGTLWALPPGVVPNNPPQENPRLTEKPAPAQPQLGASSTVALTTSMEVLNDTFKLGNLDRVSFRIVEERTVNPIQLIVTDSGEMEVPYIGRVKARDKTCKQLAFEIKPLLEKEYFKRATVIIGLDLMGIRPRGKIFVTGQVRQQGALELRPEDPLTLSQAVLSAGGLADFADKKKVKLFRRRDGAQADVEMIPVSKASKSKGPLPWLKFWSNKKDKASEPVGDSNTDTFIIDLQDIIQNGRIEKDPILKANDLIYVPERLINF